MAETKPIVAHGGNGGARLAPAPHVDDLAKAQDIARRYRCEFVDLHNFQLHHDLFKKIPVDLMFRYNFVPLDETEDGRLAIAIADPSQLMMIDEISLLLGKRILTKVSTLAQISEILKKTEQSKRVLEEASEGFTLAVVSEDEAGGEDSISIDRLTAQGDISPIIRLVDTTIFTALQRRASDIHIETRDDSVCIKFRIDGVLTQAMPPIGKEHHSTIISRIKVMSELDISERRVPQDGRFRVKYGNPERPIDFRVSIMPSIHGEDAVLRVLDKESMSEKFHKLVLDVVGFDPDDLKKFRRYIAEPYGMVLVTGPTGSGKTTTLYAAVSEIRTEEDKIITIEDPVEYQIRGITQIPVNEKKGLTFARGLRSILRHDPDKIMVGEIRDTETAQIAIQSALTGHLVFTTVHANNVVDVIGRFLNMGVEPYNFVSALNCILAQRLVRLICESCRTVVHYPAEVLEASGLDPVQWSQVAFYEGQGCIECAGTGFRGRTAIHELLDLSDRIREMILVKKPTSEIRRAAREEGMRFLRESALDKVRLGMTTLKEINKVTFIENMR
ncbi:MAG TPA: GspE/PulE family protein [Terriglobales bacterium]|nr:GspE/PulE family protein [Terriglobales bacterium]